MASRYGVAAILDVDDATVDPDDAIAGPVSHLSLRAHNGDLLLIQVPGSLWSAGLADLCCGLVRAERGGVRFLGEEWSQVSHARRQVLRSMVGRVFSRINWISYLSVLDCVILPQMHHTPRSADDLIREAVELASAFGLPGLPLARPAEVSETDLRRAACVRAFLGSPWLIVLEEPTGDDLLDLVPALVNAARQAQARGAAVVWFTRSARVWAHEALRPCRRLRFDGVRLAEIAT